MDWTAYIDLAERLMRREVGAIQGANPEALARTSVSRAYYGVFNLALELSCKRYGFRPSGKADDHEGLRVHLRGQPSATAREIAEELHRMRDRRNKADYTKTVENPERMAEASIKGAKFITDRLKTI